MASTQNLPEPPVAAPVPPAGRGWLLVLLSASNFPNYPLFVKQTGKNEAFARSSHAVADAFRRLGTPPEDILSLDDWSVGPGELLARVGQFLRERRTSIAARGESVRDVIVYYVGHGVSERNDYYLLLRQSNPTALPETSLRFASLVKTVKQACEEVRKGQGVGVRQFYVIDACFSGRAKHATDPSFVTGMKGIKTATLPARGIAVLSSCNDHEESIAPFGSDYTLFTAALLTALTCPADRRERMTAWYPNENSLSLDAIRRLINRWLEEITPTGREKPPTAQTFSLDTPEGDLQDVPLFPNPLRPGGLSPHGLLRGQRPRRVPVSRRGVLAAVGGLGAMVAANWAWERGSRPFPDRRDVDWELALVPEEASSKVTPDPRFPDERRVRYEQRTVDQVEEVRYVLPYRVAHDHGDPVQGVNLTSPAFAWEFPTLSILPKNRTSEPITLTKVVIRVAGIVAEDRPLLIVQDESYDKILIRNEGWGRVIDPVIRFTILSGRDPAGETAPFAQEVKLPSFEVKHEIPLEPFLSSFPPIAEGETVPVVGEVEYRTPSGPSRLRFKTQVVFTLPSGREIRVTGRYSVMLRHDTPGETYPVALAQELRPADDAEQYHLRIGTDRTARYKLDVELKSYDRSLGVRRLVLDVFVPRSEADRRPVPPT